MVKIDREHWPVLIMRFVGGTSEGEADAFLHELDALLLVKEPFALVVETDGESPLPPEQRRAFAAWFRRHKESLARTCQGMARISPNKILLARVASKAMSFLAPFPVQACGSEQEALAWAKAQLLTS